MFLSPRQFGAPLKMSPRASAPYLVRPLPILFTFDCSRLENHKPAKFVARFGRILSSLKIFYEQMF